MDRNSPHQISEDVEERRYTSLANVELLQGAFLLVELVTPCHDSLYPVIS